MAWGSHILDDVLHAHALDPFKIQSTPPQIQMDDDFMIGQKLPPDFFYWNYEQEATHVIDWTKRDDLVVQKRLLKRILPGYVPRWASHTPRCWNRTRVREIWDVHGLEVRRTVMNQLRTKRDIDLTSFYGPYVASRHGAPLFMFRGGTIVDGTSGETIFEIDAERNEQMLNFYGTADEIRPNYESDTRRPLFICIQDQGEERNVTFGMLTRILGLGDPSTFELERGLDGPGLAEEMGHRGAGLPKFDRGEVALMENTIESIEAGRTVARLKWIEIDAGVTSDGVVIVHHFQKTLYEDCDVGGPKLVVADATYDEVLERSEELGLPAPPRLRDVLAEFRKSRTGYQLAFQIEMKQGTDYALGRTCNRAAASGDPDAAACDRRAHGDDPLVAALADVTGRSGYDDDRIIISSFEAPRLYNFRRTCPKSFVLKLVGGQAEGVDGLERIATRWLGQSAAVSLPVKFATAERVADLRSRGIRVEIGMASVGHCLLRNAQEAADKFERDKEKMRRQMEQAIAAKPDHICSDFSRDIRGQKKRMERRERTLRNAAENGGSR